MKKSLTVFLFASFALIACGGHLDTSSDAAGCPDAASADRDPIADATPETAVADAGSDTVADAAPDVSSRGYDPAADERQNATVLCEQPSGDACTSRPADRLYAELQYFSDCRNVGRERWIHGGYRFPIVIHNDARRLHHIRIRAQLRVGNPADQYEVSVSSHPDHTIGAVLYRSPMTVEQIESGITVDVTGLGHDYGVQVDLAFQPIGTVQSRTIQWALPTDGVYDVDGATPIQSCFTVGAFMIVPTHGFLSLQSADASLRAQCVGTPLQTDTLTLDRTGLYRELGNAEVFYVDQRSDGNHVTRFNDGVAGLASWTNPYFACADVVVVPDGVITSHPIESVGIRPFTRVQWFVEGTLHAGVADRNFTIRDLGTSTARVLPGYCSMYTWDFGGTWTDCAIQIATISYRTVPGLPTIHTIDEEIAFTAEMEMIRTNTPIGSYGN